MFWGPSVFAGLRLDDAADAEEDFGANKTCQPYALHIGLLALRARRHTAQLDYRLECDFVAPPTRTQLKPQRLYRLAMPWNVSALRIKEMSARLSTVARFVCPLRQTRGQDFGKKVGSFKLAAHKWPASYRGKI